jgi:Rrf2 family transcriptional regulator, iron-sulfur cluster assembly transcription factor
MLFSRTAEYAIRAMTFLATLPPGKLAGAKEIAEAEHIPMAFLWKILQNLARHRLIRSFKGLRGGYELAHPADGLTLRMVLTATDGLDRIGNCVLGLPQCSDENACPLHDTWKELRSRLDSMIDRNTLADLARVAAVPRSNGRK